MAQYRKKPVIIEAMRVNGVHTVGEFFAFLKGAQWTISSEPRGIDIVTLEGTMHANEGDYIIKGVAGEFYPCKPDIFAETYELVS